MEFNNGPSCVMHIDINSCFASIEQQANPFLRGKPIVVAAYTTPNGCILASSVEAKKLGIKTGMRVKDGKNIYQNLIVLPSDPPKYRDVHTKLHKLLLDYSPLVLAKSIDEFVIKIVNGESCTVAREIKQRIKREIGEWITVSIGIAPNRYLAKVAAGIKKPDGLIEINKDNFLDLYARLRLTDLMGIKKANEKRLNSFGIYTVLDFYNYDKPILGCYWNLRLKGYEVDDTPFARKSYGNSVALGKKVATVNELSPILYRLTEKMCSRFRTAGYKASGIHLGIVYKNGKFWHKGQTLTKRLFDSRDVYMEAFRLLMASPSAKEGHDVPVLNLSVSVFNLVKETSLQLDFFEDGERKSRLTAAIDSTNNKWGSFTLGMAKTFMAKNVVLDRIAFGLPS